MSGSAETSIPVKLLYEVINQVVTVELKTGDRYRGELVNAESNMSVQLSSVTHTQKNGQTKKLELVYLRGSQVKFFVFPQILEDSPMFKKVASAKKKFDKKQQEKNKMQNRSAGRGRGRGRG